MKRGHWKKIASGMTRGETVACYVESDANALRNALLRIFGAAFMRRFISDCGLLGWEVWV
jgi:hypothetical protein